ncbi:MAG TPA: cupin domain-containing protein [Blastocatellia bacterium]|nr:cupin domain-containing protein [Blastocatellia bacterium]
MRDREPAHEMTDIAVAYALGTLTQREARDFEEHLETGCEICAAELPSFERTVSALAFGAPEVEPSIVVKAKLLMRLNETKKPAPVSQSREFISILASEGEWQEIQPGILLKQLYVDQATGIATSLVKMLPGTTLPQHQHSGVEQFFVIEGDCNVRGQQLGPGDYHRAEAGSIHETTHSVGGTMLLLVAPQCYRIPYAR